MRYYYQTYTPQDWRRLKILQKAIMRKYGEYNGGTISIFGSSNRAARAFARRLALLLGFKAECFNTSRGGGVCLAMENPRTGELRSIEFQACSMHDALVSVTSED